MRCNAWGTRFIHPQCTLAVVEEHRSATSLFAVQLGAVTETEIIETVISITAVKKFYQIFRLVKDLEWAHNSTRSLHAR